jgi:hypothetical protein
MGALTIAFDTTIVGALALPWVYLIIHLFFSDGENRIKQALDWVNKHQAQVPAGILLFAMTYTLGSAVSRIAHDFFDDDDLHVRIDGWLIRWPVTEDRIRAHVYCDDDSKDLLPNVAGNTALAKEIDSKTFRNFNNFSQYCKQIMRGWVRTASDEEGNPGDFVKTAADIFGLQENTLMDKGGDYSARLRQAHDQIMVLRGAAFNGLIAFSLCLFAWGVVLSDNPGCNGKSKSEDKSVPDENPRPWVRWIVMLAPAFYLIAGGIALYHHIHEKSPAFPPDPPYMEFTLLLLAGAGLWVLWPPAPKALRHTPEDGAKQATEKQKEKEAAATPHWRIERWGRLVSLSLVLTFAAFLGWWSTEVFYRDQVIYSFDSQFADTQGATVPKK